MLVLKNNATIIELFKKCSEIHNNYKDEMDELESLEKEMKESKNLESCILKVIKFC